MESMLDMPAFDTTRRHPDPKSLKWHQAHAVVVDPATGKWTDVTPPPPYLSLMGVNTEHPVFEEYDPITQHQMLSDFTQDERDLIAYLDRTDGAWEAIVQNPSPLKCYFNALAYVKLHPEYKIAVGSGGFMQPKKGDKPEHVHWEFG